MAVKGISVKFNKAQGINQALKAPLGTAEDIINFRKHPTEGWLCDRGIEPWWDQSPSFNVGGEIISDVQRALLGEKFDSLFVWTKQSSNQVYILAEQGGYLYYIWGNKGSGLLTTGEGMLSCWIQTDTSPEQTRSAHSTSLLETGC
jgi:hypothetical protein